MKWNGYFHHISSIFMHILTLETGMGIAWGGSYELININS